MWACSGSSPSLSLARRERAREGRSACVWGGKEGKKRALDRGGRRGRPGSGALSYRQCLTPRGAAGPVAAARRVGSARGHVQLLVPPLRVVDLAEVLEAGGRDRDGPARLRLQVPQQDLQLGVAE